MKKITSLIILCLTVNFTFSQVLFEDDFDGSGPGLAGWTLVNNDGLTPDPNVAQFTDAWIQADDFDNAGDMVAMSTSWYSPAGTADDWMITPAINLTSDAILSWEEEAQDANYPDGYEVRLSTQTTALADFTNVLFTAATGSPAVWAPQSADLSAYTGETVYIAWRNNSTDQFVLMINNVLVEIPAAFDASITVPAAAQDQYTQIPLEQIAPLGTDATIENIGGPITNAIATVTITDGSGTVYTEDSAPFAIAAGANQAVNFTGYTPTMADTYTTTFTVTMDETDGIPSNNTVMKTTEVTTNTYARDDNTPTGTLGIGANNGGYLGQQFDILETEDILSVTFAIGNGTGVITGLNVKATVWDMVGGVPNAIIAQTDFVTVTAVENDMYTANITGGPFTLAPGQYLVAVEEPDAAGGMPTDENVQVVTTTAIYTPGATWVNWPTNPNGAWSNSEDFAFEIAYLIRPNFQDENLGIENNTIENFTIGLFPNPASNVVTISNPNQVNLLEARIIDVTGRVIKTIDLSSNLDSERRLDVSSLSPANYFVTIKSSQGEVTKQLIIK